MGGPIVRSGASPEFSKNWEKIFGARTPVALAGKAPSGQPTGTTKKTKSSTGKTQSASPAKKSGGKRSK